MNIRAEEAPLMQNSVDVVVSEWMGYFLIFERMLPSVVAVRNKCLRRDGIMIPRRSKLFLAAFSREGSPESLLMQLEDNKRTEQALISFVQSNQLLSSKSEILELDMMTVEDSFSSFTSRF